MKKYPNINKYFNRTPKGYLIFLMLLHILCGVGIFVLLIPETEIGWGVKLGYLIYVIIIFCVIYHFYSNIVTLANAKMGKHLKKYYGLEKEALVAQLDAIAEEVGNPVYADVSRKHKYNAFFITEHWLVGTDGVNLLRANACRREDIVKFDMGTMIKIRKGTSYIYYILMVTDKNNYTYKFWLRSQEHLERAYEKLETLML